MSRLFRRACNKAFVLRYIEDTFPAPFRLKPHRPKGKSPFIMDLSLRLLIHQYRRFRHLRHQPWLRRPMEANPLINSSQEEFEEFLNNWIQRRMAPTNTSLAQHRPSIWKLNQSHSQRTSTMPCFERFNGAARAFGTFYPNYGQLGGESKFLFAAVWFISHWGCISMVSDIACWLC